ncbi:MAG: hypothetical protein HYY49_09650 [Ignavibacteriales bacterium]|nr:hypothetical protein [Ignavibacteriales bacterium]
MKYLSFIILLPYITNLTPPDTSTTSVEFGVITGKYPEACGPDHSYFAGGGGISWKDDYGKLRSLTYGALGFFGEDLNGGSNFVVGAYPYVRYDHRWFAIGGGLNFFSSRVQGGKPFVFPGATLRLGPSDIFYLEGNFLHHHPGNFARPFLKLGIGVPVSGNSSLLGGISDSGWYINPMIGIDDRITLDPFVAYAAPNLHNFSFTLHYQLR